jgi:hypothetical protein
MEFKINSKEDAKRFEDLLHKFLTKHTKSPFKIEYNLDKVYQSCQRYKQGGKYFAACYDLMINITYVHYELFSGLDLWNEFYDNISDPTIYDDVNPLDDEDYFLMKIHYLQKVTSFISRFRSSWDKIMGLYYMVLDSPNYQRSYIQAKSRKRSFIKNFKNHELVNREVVEYVENELTNFDNKFRTAELHNAGLLRKYVLGSGDLDEDHPLRVILENYYNRFYSILPKVLEIFWLIEVLPDVIDKVKARKENINNANR